MPQHDDKKAVPDPNHLSENHFTLFRIMPCLGMMFSENRFALFRIMP